MSSRSLAAAAVALSLVGGCTFHAHQIDPRPWIEGKRVPASLRVEVDEGIENDFILPEREGLPPLDVKGWRDALVVGFDRGRPQRFAPPEAEGAEELPGWQLVVTEATPVLIPLAWGEGGRAAQFTAKVSYRARLFGPDKAVVAEPEGRVRAPDAFGGVNDASDLLASAIAVMVHDLVELAAEKAAGDG